MNPLILTASEFIAGFEQFRSAPYLPTANDKWTIGFGNTHYEDGTAVQETDPEITQQRAYQLLDYYVSKFLDIVQSLVTVELTDNQTVALVSFEYNTGSLRYRNAQGVMEDSTLLTKLNAADFTGAAAEFPKWVHQNGVVLAGLVSRRQQEKELFLK